MVNVMLVRVMVELGSVFGMILNTYTADPVNWNVIVVGMGELRGVASCQVLPWI